MYLHAYRRMVFVLCFSFHVLTEQKRTNRKEDNGLYPPLVFIFPFCWFTDVNAALMLRTVDGGGSHVNLLSCVSMILFLLLL
jgi:hypothetical protein